ncbi:MAG TPA: NTP transferase domain-containing protein, partial [Hyphomicrobiaceae bacterium]|nr:NTP transferase domain-containing protein [Hyphomicrobiaceae bacterium]
MTSRPLLTIVLAAGKGTRMKSAIPKVLHCVGGLSLLGHVLTAIRGLGEGRTAVVIGPEMDGVRAEVEKIAPKAEVFVQEPQLGTAHAVLAARRAIEQHEGDVLVVFGDTPFITPSTLNGLLASLDASTPLAVLGFHAADPNGYGRLIMDGPGQVSAIRE